MRQDGAQTAPMALMTWEAPSASIFSPKAGMRARCRI